MNYNFKVTDAKDVDIARIIKEAPPEADAILLTGANAILMLRDSFLARFKSIDGLKVAGNVLNPWWGDGTWVTVDNAPNAVQFNTPAYRGDTEWRAMHVNKSDIGSIVADLHYARAFKPSREVRVSYL